MKRAHLIAFAPPPPPHPLKGYSDYTFMGQEYKEGVVAKDPYA